MTQPVIYMIAGPNGAGKTTAALKLLPDFLSVHEFVNADEIARGLNPLHPDGQAVMAGRLMLHRIDDLIAAGKNFAFETTGASHVFAEKMQYAKANNYQLRLIYLWLPNDLFAQQRVRLRVLQGGHNIPEDTIVRRYRRGLCNLVHLYLPLMDHAVIIDSANSTTDIIAVKNGGVLSVFKQDLWRDIEEITKELDHD